MSKSDYYRPADYQITQHQKCPVCGKEYETEGCYQPPCFCSCGGTLCSTGESYPASVDDLDEERDTTDGYFHNRY